MTNQELIDHITDHNREAVRFYLKSYLNRLDEMMEARETLDALLAEVTVAVIPLEGMNEVIEQDKLDLATRVEQSLRWFRENELKAHSTLQDATAASVALKVSCAVALKSIQTAQPPEVPPTPEPPPTP